jgi:hypothetical protein
VVAVNVVSVCVGVSTAVDVGVEVEAEVGDTFVVLSAATVSVSVGVCVCFRDVDSVFNPTSSDSLHPANTTVVPAAAEVKKFRRERLIADRTSYSAYPLVKNVSIINSHRTCLRESFLLC